MCVRVRVWMLARPLLNEARPQYKGRSWVAFLSCAAREWTIFALPVRTTRLSMEAWAVGVRA